MMNDELDGMTFLIHHWSFTIRLDHAIVKPRRTAGHCRHCPTGQLALAWSARRFPFISHRRDPEDKRHQHAEQERVQRHEGRGIAQRGRVGVLGGIPHDAIDVPVHPGR